MKSYFFFFRVTNCLPNSIMSVSLRHVPCSHYLLFPALVNCIQSKGPGSRSSLSCDLVVLEASLALSPVKCQLVVIHTTKDTSVSRAQFSSVNRPKTINEAVVESIKKIKGGNSGWVENPRTFPSLNFGDTWAKTQGVIKPD